MVHRNSRRTRPLRRGSKLHQHDWILGVFEDLIEYATKHKMTNLEADLTRALASAKHHKVLAKLNAVQGQGRSGKALGLKIDFGQKEKPISIASQNAPIKFHSDR